MGRCYYYRSTYRRSSYAIGSYIANGSWEKVSLSGTLKAAFWGAVSGAVTFGIGDCFTTAEGVATAFSKTFGGVLVKAAAHGIAQGTLAMMQNDGAGFLSGASGGFFGSLGATAWGGAGGKWGGIAGKYAGSDVGTIAFGALSGGVGAELSGGNFWQGAIAGGIVSGLNHLSQKMQSYEDASYDPNKVEKNNSSDIANGDVINMHNDGSALDLWAQQSKPANGTVEVHAHGNDQGFGGMYKLDEIKTFLYDKSPTWRQMVDYGKNITLKLFSCSTGSGSNSIAKQISMAFKNVTVVAPTNYWRVVYTNYFIFKQLHYGSVADPGRWKSFKQ